MARRRRAAAVFATVMCAATAAAFAAGDEIQVYLDDITPAGTVVVSTHLNDVLRGRRTPEFPGELPPSQVFQATPEINLGLGGTFDGALYLPMAVAPGGHAFLNGIKVRFKWIAPHDEKRGWFWGGNTELSRVATRVSESRWGLEVRPIVGWRGGPWLVALNPILGVALSSGQSHRPEFEPCVKIGYSVSERVSVGIEHYAAFGPLFRFDAPNQRGQNLYLVADVEGRGWDFNVGVGRGLTDVSDRWVAKAIVDLPF